MQGTINAHGHRDFYVTPLLLHAHPAHASLAHDLFFAPFVHRDDKDFFSFYNWKACVYFSHVEEQLCVGYTLKVHFLKGQNTLKISALWLASSDSCNLLGIGADSDVRAS